MKSPAIAVRERHQRSKAVECAPGSVGGILTHALVADARRTLAACWRTAAVTTGTNVPPGRAENLVHVRRPGDIR